MRRFILAFAGLLACCCCSIGGGASQATAALTAAKATQQKQAAIKWLGSQIVGYQKVTWRWERLMGVPLTATQGRMLAEMSISDVERTVQLWHRLAAEARPKGPEPAPQGGVPLHPPLRGRLAVEYRERLLRRPADEPRLPARPTRHGCCGRRARPITGRPSSSYGRQKKPRRAGVSTPGRTPRGSAGCSDVGDSVTMT